MTNRHMPVAISIATVLSFVLALLTTFGGASAGVSYDNITNDTRVSWEPSVVVLSLNASHSNLAVLGNELALTTYAGMGQCIMSVFDATRLATAASPAAGAAIRNNLLLNQAAPLCGKLPRNATLPVQYAFHPTAVAYRRGPSAAAAGAHGTLIVADSVPHSNVFHIERTTAVTATGRTRAQLRRVAGSPACDFDIYRPPNNSVAADMRIGWTWGIVSDDATGRVYLAQAYAVIEIAGSGMASYYFGNATREGSKSDAFNYDIPRWHATTLNPQQMVIDTRSRVMYVVESGLSTVRAIDMTTGRATVALGWLTYETFPPVLCIRDNCTTSDVQLISPRGVALHYAAALKETWLFVSDMSAAVIYRVVVETGVVTTVSGTLLVGCCRKDLVRAVGDLAVYFDAVHHRGSLFAVTRGISRYSWTEPAVPPTPAGRTDVGTASEAAVTTSVFVGGIGAGVAVTEAVTMLVLAGTQCAATASTPKTSILQSVFFFASTNDGGPPPSATAWLLLGTGALFAVAQFGAVVVLRYGRGQPSVAASSPTRAAWLFAMESARFPAFCIIFSDVVLPLAAFSGAEAATAHDQTPNERASAAASVCASLVVAIAIRCVFATTPLGPLERLEFRPRVTNPLAGMAACIPQGRASADAVGEDGDDLLAPSSPMGSGLPHSVSSTSFTSSFASLLGIAHASSKHRTATMQALEASMSAYAYEAAGAEDNSGAALRHAHHQGCGEHAMPRGYWLPTNLTRMWGPLFSKTMETFWFGKFAETTISLVAAVFSGVAASYRQSAACQVLMGTLASMFFVAAIAVAVLRPFRHPSENVMMPLSFALLAVMCILRAVPSNSTDSGEDAVALDILQIGHSCVIATKTFLHLCVWWADTDVRQLHVHQAKTHAPLSTSSAMTTRSSPLESPSSNAWSRQQTDDDGLFALPLQAQEAPTTTPIVDDGCSPDAALPSQRGGHSIEDVADPVSLMEGRASRLGFDERSAPRANQVVSLVVPDGASFQVPRVTKITPVHRTTPSDNSESDSDVEL